MTVTADPTSAPLPDWNTLRFLHLLAPKPPLGTVGHIVEQLLTPLGVVSELLFDQAITYERVARNLRTRQRYGDPRPHLYVLCRTLYDYDVPDEIPYETQLADLCAGVSELFHERSLTVLVQHDEVPQELAHLPHITTARALCPEWPAKHLDFLDRDARLAQCIAERLQRQEHQWQIDQGLPPERSELPRSRPRL